MRTERRADGSLWVTPELALADYRPNLPQELAARAAAHPQKTYLAERRGGAEAPWYRASYGEVDTQSRAVAAWLLARDIPAGRSLLILSGNSVMHAVFKYGAMAARLPACPVSVNYALMGGDYGRLTHVIDMVRPAVVFAEQTHSFRSALESNGLDTAERAPRSSTWPIISPRAFWQTGKPMCTPIPQYTRVASSRE